MSQPDDSQLICGLHPVRHALETGARACHKVVAEAGKPNPRLKAVLDLARDRGVRVDTLPRDVFRKKYGNLNHQRLVGYFAPTAPLELEDLIEHAAGLTPQPILILLDEIQDPHNLGAILRSAEALGLTGAVVPRHRSARLNETVAKCAAGALESLPIVQAGNLVQAIERLKESGYWIVGTDMEGTAEPGTFAFGYPLALVIGGESKGVRPLVKKHCDALLRIPMSGRVESLNASAAAAIVFYEAVRGRAGSNSRQ